MSISAKERREIPDNKMGDPAHDKFPLDTKEHIRSAANLIGHAEDEKQVAENILRRAKEEGVSTDSMHKVKQVAGVSEQVPPMSDGTSLGNAPPRMMAPYYDEQDMLFSQLDKMDSRRHVLTFEDAQRIVTEIHAQVEKDSKPPTGNQNCQLCVWCAEAQCRGIKALPRPIYSPRDPALEIVGETIVLHPVRQKIASQRDVIEAVRSNVDSRWYVHVNWAGSEGGHEFLVVNINDYAYIMDPQAGILEEIDETDSPKVKYFMHANYANSYIVRLDNRSFNSTLLNLANNPNRVLPWDPKLDIPYMKAHGMLSDEDYQAAMDMGDLPIQEAACTASLLTVKNQLMNLLGSDFEFIGGSLIPKFTMKSRMKPDVAIEVNIVGPNVEVTPVYKGIPDMLHKRRGIALMQASHVVADFARELVENYKPKPVQEGVIEKARDMTLMPVRDFKYDKVFYGDPTNGGSVRALNGKPLFVTPHPGLASIFLGRRHIFRQLSQMGYHEVNLGYDEWGELGRCDQPLTDVHVYVRNQPDLKPFTAEYDGYLHTIDCSQLKENIFRYPWMSDPDHEVLIAKVPEVKIENVQRLHIKYHVRGIRGKVPETPYQESATMDFKDDKLLSVLKNSKYGVAYHDKLITNPSEQDYINKWHCLSPNEFINIGGGVCYDFVEWEADYLKKHQIPFKKFHISHHIGFDKTDVGKDAATHSICVAIVNGKYMYIEGSSKKLAKAIGYIKEFNNIDELLDFAVKHTIHGPEQSKLIIIDYTNVDNLIGLNLFDYQNRIFSKGKVIKSDFIQEGAFQDIKNGVNPYSSKLVFHVTDKSHFDGQIFEPRVPEYLDPYDPNDKYFEDNTTPRVCFSTSIEGALNGIMCNMERDTPERFNKMYVYIPEKPFEKYKHKTTKDIVSDKTVWDANVTREVWITEPVRMKLYGVIQVDQVSDMKRKKAVPNAKNEKHTRPYFTFKWHWVVPPKVLEKSTKFEYSIDKVAMWLSNDLKKFKYGLIKNGRLQTGNVSESDYQKYWVYHSGEEVDQAGGGNCWDYVEYEAGFLKAYGVPYKKYFMNFTKTDGKTTVNTHTICVVPYEGKFIYIEGAFKRITSEWGHEWRRTFDSLKEIFQYVAEVSAEYDNQDLNYGVWDYTDAKIDYGTPADDFCKWIMTKCRMIYDGEAKKPTVKKEGYRVSRFGSIFQEEDEKLSETENITIGDLDLGGDDDSDDEGPGLPGYIEDRMSDDDLEAYNSDDDDFKIPEEGDFESFKVSDEKLEEARGPIEPQPDENLDAANVDLGSFGKDTSDVQNEYDPKEVTILMTLMASEADAMNEYMDGAKETNIDVLRRLYADIANEERFHMEQLLYAKCELTGEKYVPKDPDVKSEYEELLKMGMDEETAMQTAVDKCHIRGSITIEDDIDDVDEISKDMETMETTIMMFNALYDSTAMILESGNASKEDVERAMTVFTEACITQEAVYNATAADSEKSALSKANKHGPIQLLRDTIRFLIRTIMAIIRKFVEATKRISNRSREIRRFIKNNGLGAIFSEKASFYFVNLKFPQAAYVDTHLDTLLGLAADTLQACAYNLNVQLNMQVNVQRDPKLNINNNMQRGAELLQGVQLVKSAFVIPKDNAEQERIATALFGLSDQYDVDGKTYNTLNTLKLKCDAWSRFMQYTEGFLNELDKLQQNNGSVYYTNRKKYDQAEKCIEAVVKTCKAWVSAIQSDINTIIKLDQKAMIAATEEYEKQSKAVNPHQQRLSENYERNYRTAESSGQKVGKFSRFGR